VVAQLHNCFFSSLFTSLPGIVAERMPGIAALTARRPKNLRAMRVDDSGWRYEAGVFVVRDELYGCCGLGSSVLYKRERERERERERARASE